MKLLNLNIQLFASASATQTIYSNGSSKYGYDISVSWEEQSGYDAEKNTTTIKGYASLYGKNVSFSTSTGGTLYFDWYDNKTNTWTNKASLAIKATTRGTTYKAEATFSVEHNADGTLKGKARVRWDKTGTNQWIPNDGSKETSEQTLTTIPRATKLGNHSGTLGTKLPFTWSRAANFTHTLEITFGSKKYTYPGLTTGYEWLVPQDSPNELYQQMSGKVGTGTIKLTTYSGSTPVGSTQTATLTLNAVENNVKPVIGNATFKDTNSAMVGITNGTDVIVANKSLTQINFTFSTRGYAKAKTLLINNVSRTIPTGVVRSNDASITDYSVSVDLGTIKSNSFTIAVTDTRGYPANDTPKIDDAKFISYIPLDVSSSFKRIAPTTGEVGMTFNGNFWEGNFGKVTNSLSISYKYKKKEDTTYSNLITLVKDSDYKISNNKYYSGTGSSQDVIELEALFDYKSIYDVQFFVSDAVTTLPTINLVITKGIPIFWWNGEKVVVNGELYVADENGENTSLVPKVKNEYSTSNTDTYSCNYINQKINNDLIRVVLGSNKTMSNTAYTIIPFNTIAERINANNSFEFNSSTGEITILNENVKKIRIYASVLDNAWGSDDMYLRIKKNGSAIKASYLKGQSNIALDTEISATKNDVIAVDFYCSVTKTLANGWEYTQMVVSVA